MGAYLSATRRLKKRASAHQLRPRQLEDENALDLQTRRQAYGLGRVLALSDAFFAFAMTLLVIQLTVPNLPAEHTQAQLASSLLEQRPTYVSYALSFVVLALFWYGHHHLFRYIKRYDTLLIVVNFAVLLLVAVQPFPTALLARYDNDPVATTVYAAFFAANGIFSCALHWYSTSHHRLINSALGSQVIRNMVLRSVIAPALFLFSIPVAFWSPAAARLIWLLIPMGMLLIAGRARSAP